MTKASFKAVDKSNPKKGSKVTQKMSKRAVKISESRDIYQFINHIVQKNYSVANKYLQREIDNRIMAKIRANL